MTGSPRFAARAAARRALVPGRRRLRMLAGGCVAAAMVLATGSASAADLPVFDAHIHYSHDAVESVPVADVVALMRKAGLKGALVSSSDDAGTQKLLAAAPDLIVPSLRPYRMRSDLSGWVRSDAVLAYVEDHLRRFRYAALGEFHLYGADADLPIPRRILELGVRNGLVLHAHSDVDAIERIFRQHPGARVLWAHSGFERPAVVREMLRKHPTLWADLAYRSEMGGAGRVDADWAEAFREFPERFMVGTDTFTPERLHYIPEHAAFSRGWLSALAPELAERIAWRNAEALLVPVWKANRARPLPGQVSVPLPQGVGFVTVAAPAAAAALPDCRETAAVRGVTRIESQRVAVAFRTEPAAIRVGQPFVVRGTACPRAANGRVDRMAIDAQMPAHRHGMNYAPKLGLDEASDRRMAFSADGFVFHMPGRWQFVFDVRVGESTERLTRDIDIR